MSIELLSDGNVLRLGTDRLRERASETQALIKNLAQEETDLLDRLRAVRGTRRFLIKDYLQLWNRIQEGEK